MQLLDTRKVVQLSGDSLSAIYYKETTGSTNDDALELARGGALPGTVVVAESQTHGRGRRGASWACSAGEALAFSYLVSGAVLERQSLLPSLLAGLACARAMESHDVSAKVKWPNDLLLGRKKLAGILTEMTGQHLVIGIGLNVNVTSFPDELADSATSLKRELGRPVEREAVLAAVIRELAAVFTEEKQHIDELRERCALTGKAVSLLIGQKRMEGHITGLGDEGELLLWTGRSTQVLRQADEIRFL